MCTRNLHFSSKFQYTITSTGRILLFFFNFLVKYFLGVDRGGDGGCWHNIFSMLFSLVRRQKCVEFGIMILLRNTPTSASTFITNELSAAVACCNLNLT